MMLRWGRVVATHPEDHSVDITMTDDGTRLAGVQVLTPSGGTRSGVSDLPTPAASEDEEGKWDITRRTESDVIAAVAYFDNMRMPVVIGFMYPQVNQMLFAEKGRRIDRHESDVYSTVDKDGNMEWSHPSGTFFRVATSADHEDLSGKDTDGNWGVDRNTDKRVHVRLQVGNGGAVKAKISIDPDGNMAIENEGNVTVATKGGVAIAVEGDTEITTANLKINAPVEINGASLTHNGKNVGGTHLHPISGGSSTGTTEAPQ